MVFHKIISNPGLIVEKYKLGINNNLDFPVKPRWSLDEEAVFLKGAGVRL